MNRYFALTLDLESGISGVLKDEYSVLKKPEKIEKLLDFFKKENVKISVFVVGEILEKFPEIISIFRKYDCEFHCHSYSHQGKFADSEREIIKSSEAYSRFFKKDPIGYRAPQGRISKKGIQLLDKHGFKFDSSVFPSYYPNPFKYLFKSKEIHGHKGFSIIEIPATPVSPLRFILSISYIKLLGYKTYEILIKMFRLPGIVVFGSHLHDFFLDIDTFKKLPLFWRMIYSRNRNKGPIFLKKIIDLFRERGYKFVYISEIYSDYVSKKNE